MPKRSTLEQVITAAKSLHGDKYDYSLCNEYENQRTKLPVICHEHGVFHMTAGNHLSGKGCRLCGLDRSSESQRSSFDDWVEKSQHVHNNFYTYSKAFAYKSNRSKMEIICPVHGKFEMSAGNHLSGQGCKECVKQELSLKFRKSLDAWKTECTIIHNNRFSYELCASYENQRSRMLIACNEHGTFDMSAAAHLRGQICPSCAKSGFDSKAPANLYVLKCQDLIKVGITNRETIDRVKQINKDSKLTFEVVSSTLFKLGSDAYKTEQTILKILRSLYRQPEYTFDGCTECFFNADICFIDSLIHQLNEQHSSQSLETA